MEKKRKIRVREPLWLGFVKIFARPFARLKWGYKIKGRYRAKKGEKIIVLANHQTDIDPLLVRLSVNRYLYTVATDTVFSNRRGSKWLMRLGAIPKKKGLADMKSVINMLSVAKNGGSILLFPEGNRSFAEFQFYITENLGSLLKKLKCTIVIFNFHGGFGVNPRFGSKKRKGPYYGEVKKVLKLEDYEKLSPAELNKIVVDNLKVFDANSGYSYKSKARAEYLERMYFLCPKCGDIHSLKSEGNYIKCHNCGLEVEYTEKLTLKSDDPEFKFTKLVEWYDLQKKWVREYNIEKGKVIFEDSNVTLKLAIPFQDRILIDQGHMSLTDEKLTVGNTSFNVSDTLIATPVSGKDLCLMINDQDYVISGQDRFNSLKYVLMFNKLDTKMKLEKIDNYFTLE